MSLIANTTIRELFEMANEFVRRNIIETAHTKAIHINKILDAMKKRGLDHEQQHQRTDGEAESGCGESNDQ